MKKIIVINSILFAFFSSCSSFTNLSGELYINSTDHIYDYLCYNLFTNSFTPLYLNSIVEKKNVGHYKFGSDRGINYYLYKDFILSVETFIDKSDPKIQTRTEKSIIRRYYLNSGRFIVDFEVKGYEVKDIQFTENKYFILARNLYLPYKILEYQEGAILPKELITSDNWISDFRYYDYNKSIYFMENKYIDHFTLESNLFRYDIQTKEIEFINKADGVNFSDNFNKIIYENDNYIYYYDIITKIKHKTPLSPCYGNSSYCFISNDIMCIAQSREKPFKFLDIFPDYTCYYKYIFFDTKNYSKRVLYKSRAPRALEKRNLTYIEEKK